jgi:hypothetical protein
MIRNILDRIRRAITLKTLREMQEKEDIQEDNQ